MRRGLQLSSIALAMFAISHVCFSAQMISVDQTGTNSGGGNLDEIFVVSGDGRLAAFSSHGTHYVATDTNGISDLFVYDCDARAQVWNTTYSLAPVSGNPGSAPVRFTPDGRFLLFVSRATNHVPGLSFTGAALYQLYLRDLQSNATALVTLAHDGTAAADASVLYGGSSASIPCLSTDGRFVAFAASASNLVTNSLAPGNNLFLRDLQAHTTELISVAGESAEPLDKSTSQFLMSTNGRYFAFVTAATNVISDQPNTNGSAQVYWRDRLTGRNVLVSSDVDGTIQKGPTATLGSLSSDGRYVSFLGFATNHVANQNDTNGTGDIFIRDIVAGETWLVTRNTNGVTTKGRFSGGRFSANGEWLIFSAPRADLVPGIADVNSDSTDLFAHHIPTRTNAMLSVSFTRDTGADTFVGDGFAQISSSGRYTVFTSSATNLLPGLTNRAQRMLLRDQYAGLTRNVFHVGTYPTPAYNQARFVISENERYIFFLTTANFDPSIRKTNSTVELFRAPLFPPRFVAEHSGFLSGVGLAGHRYVLESSTNLLHWTAIVTNMAGSDGTLTATNPPRVGSSTFFRLRWE